MRYFGNRQISQAPTLPDSKLSLLLTAGSPQAFDYPAGTDLVRISAGSTQGSLGVIFFTPNSTGAALPTTGAVVVTTHDSSGGIAITPGEDKVYQRPRSSTGFSVISPSSAYFCVEFWSRAGTT